MKHKDYFTPAARSETHIELLPNTNYRISFLAFVEGEAFGTGGSLRITYETTDFKTFITSSVVIERYN